MELERELERFFLEAQYEAAASHDETMLVSEENGLQLRRILDTAGAIGMPLSARLTERVELFCSNPGDFSDFAADLIEDEEIETPVYPFLYLLTTRQLAADLSDYDNPKSVEARNELLAELLDDAEIDNESFEHYVRLTNLCLAEYMSPFMELEKRAHMGKERAEHDFVTHMQLRSAQKALNARLLASLSARSAERLVNQYGHHDDQADLVVLMSNWTAELYELMTDTKKPEAETAKAYIDFLDEIEPECAYTMGIPLGDVHYIVVEGAEYLKNEGYYLPE